MKRYLFFIALFILFVVFFFLALQASDRRKAEQADKAKIESAIFENRLALEQDSMENNLSDIEFKHRIASIYIKGGWTLDEAEKLGLKALAKVKKETGARPHFYENYTYESYMKMCRDSGLDPIKTLYILKKLPYILKP